MGVDSTRSTKIAPVSLSTSYLTGSASFGISMMTLISSGGFLPVLTRSRPMNACPLVRRAGRLWEMRGPILRRPMLRRSSLRRGRPATKKATRRPPSVGWKRWCRRSLARAGERRQPGLQQRDQQQRDDVDDLDRRLGRYPHPVPFPRKREKGEGAWEYRLRLQQRDQQQCDDIDDLDQWVDRRAGGVLVGI